MEENKSPFDLSVGAFTHFYYKLSTFTRLGPGLGVAVSPFDGKTRYMLGLSALLGREKMIGLSAGVAWAKVKHLSGAVLLDSEGSYLTPEATVVPTFEKIKPSFFFGVTYNLFSTRK